MKNQTTKILVGLLIALIAVYGVNIVAVNGTLAVLQEKVNEQKPAEVELVILADASCKDCFSPSLIVDALKQAENVNILKEETIEFSSERGKELISQLGIEKIPTIVILGETGKDNVKALWGNEWKETENGVFFMNVLPPYRNLASGTIGGLVELTELKDSSCADCFDFAPLV